MIKISAKERAYELSYYRAVKLFRDIPINLDKLNRDSKNIYKRELLNTVAFLYPELFRYP